MTDYVEDPPHQSGALQTAKDLFAGAVGGVAQVLLGEFCFISCFARLLKDEHGLPATACTVGGIGYVTS